MAGRRCDRIFLGASSTISRMVDAAVEHAVAERLAVADLRAAATLALRAYGPKILGYLRATLAPAAADDAFSLFCELFWKGLPKFRGEASILTWSYQVAWGSG